jgi:hypothetical protein
VVSPLTIPKEKTPAPIQAMEEKPSIKSKYTVNMTMVNMMITVEAWTLQLSKANDHRYRGYQTTRAYATNADHPPPHTPMNFPPLNGPLGPPYH